jgi:hypothetical protein
MVRLPQYDIPKPNDQSVDQSFKLVDALVTSIRRRHIVGSRNAAIATATLIKNIVRHVKYSTVEELINIIKAIGKRLMDANPRGTPEPPLVFEEDNELMGRIGSRKHH